MSPYHTPEEILAKFPPTHIMACEIDPLRDSAFEFSLKLMKLGIKTKIFLLKDHIHGFLGMDMISEYHKNTRKMKELMKELFEVAAEQE